MRTHHLAGAPVSAPSERSIPATFIRGGTSKGVFLNWRDLPDDAAERDQMLLAVMGSPDPYLRQLDGMGGGISSLSKVMMVRAGSRDDIDIEYLFGQVAVDRMLVDYSANCGNLTSAVGLFARQEGLIPADHQGPVRLLNLNTSKVVHTHTEPDRMIEIPGVPGLGAAIRLEFRDPGGTTTGALLPSGHVTDMLARRDGRPIEVSLVDAAIPMVFVAAESFGLKGTETPDELDADPELVAELEHLRRQAAVVMGLASDAQGAALATPKIALVSAPAAFVSLDGNACAQDGHDLTVRTVSMNKFHRAVPLTSAMCVGVACGITGSIPHRVSSPRDGDISRIGTPSGVLQVSARVSSDAGEWKAAFAGVYRTARRLMTGTTYYQLP